MQISDEMIAFRNVFLRHEKALPDLKVAQEAVAAYVAALSLPVQPVAWTGRVAKILSHDDYMQLVFEGYSIVHESHSTPPVPPTKGPEDDLIAALERVKALVVGDRAPNWNSDTAVTQSRMRIADICDLALRSRPASALPVVGEDSAK